MIDENIFAGKLVRLMAEEPKAFAEAFNRWSRDTEYHRLLDNDPARAWSQSKFIEWIEQDMAKGPAEEYFFEIRTLADDKLIGFIGLFGISFMNGEAWVGIGLGERDYWGKGYGTDAMRILLRYAFAEMNLNRVTLGVFEYNPRAIKSYEKAGFRLEGRERSKLNRDGRHWDMVHMGVLREEWEKTSDQ